MHRFLVTSLTLVLMSACGTAQEPDLDAGGDTPDASSPEPDGGMSNTPDAWVDPSCPSYAAAVQPIYSRHCSNCHTTGRDAHFGSSISVARSTTSACNTAMAACTVQLGRPGGQMARADPYGGFSAADIATIQSWASCGMPD